jgi:phenylalanyl-tRNA synthetase beta chain
VAKPTATPAQIVERRVRRAAAARLNEAVTWSFLPEGEAGAFGGGLWKLANPIEDLKAMRPSLLPGCVGARRNLDRGATSVPVRDRPPLSAARPGRATAEPCGGAGR